MQLSTLERMRQPLLTLTTLAMLPVLPVSAQWELFPVRRRSYFQYASQGVSHVDMVLMDSVWEDLEGGRYLYNKRQFRHDFIGNCALYGLADLAMSSSLSYMLDMNLVMDSLLVRNDTVFFSWEYSTTPFYFLPKAAVGQSWIVHSTYTGNQASDILITCTGIAEGTFLGITDSVKTFTLDALGSQESMDTHQVRLSKEHGLLEYVPFTFFLVHPAQWSLPSYQLLGMGSDSLFHGYRQPGFADYFHLAPGDILLWEHFTDPGWIDQGPPYYEYSRDSITAALITADSVVYTYDEVYTDADQNITFQSGLEWRYLKEVYSGFLQAAPNYLAKGNPWDTLYPMLWASSPITLSIDPDDQDTISTVNFSTEDFHFDEGGCMASGATDLNQTIQINSRVGLAGTWNWLHPSEYQSVIIAYRVGGVETGDINMGEWELPWRTAMLRVHPNPATERVFPMGGGPCTNMSYTILDGLGREVQHGVVKNDGIPVELLPRGMYVLRLFRSSGVQSARFVKE